MSDDKQIRVLGTLGTVDGVGVVRMEDRFDTDIDDLWSALVDTDRLRRWLGEFGGDLRVGGDFRAHYWASGWEGTGHVEACEPPRHLLVTTVMDGATDPDEGRGSIEAWLTTHGSQTILVVEERGMPVEHLPDYGAGIQIHVEDLGAHLAGRDRCDAQTRWEQLRPSYEALAVNAPAPPA